MASWTWRKWITRHGHFEGLKLARVGLYLVNSEAYNKLIVKDTCDVAVLGSHG